MRKADRLAYDTAMQRDAMTCQRCHRGQPVTRHHRKNRSQGGKTTPANLLLLCGTGTTGCHGYVTDHPREAWREGVSVPSWARPEDWPHRRWIPDRYGVHRPVWVVYDNDGGWLQISELAALEIIGDV